MTSRPGLERAAVQSPTVAPPSDGADSPSALDGGSLGIGSTTPFERAVGTASPAVVDGPLGSTRAGRDVSHSGQAGVSPSTTMSRIGAGRAVVGLQSAAGSFPGCFEREAADGGTVRVGVDLHLVYEGERVDDSDVAALVQGAVIDRVPQEVAGLEMARAESTAAELRGARAVAALEQRTGERERFALGAATLLKALAPGSTPLQREAAGYRIFDKLVAAAPFPGETEDARLATLRRVAIAIHRGQRDQQNAPYRAHILAVTDMVSDEAKPVALFHDAVEDERLTREVVAALLDADEALAVWHLNRARVAHLSYAQYITLLCAAQGRAGRLAREVKLADLTHNLGRLTPELERLRARYEPALERIAAAIVERDGGKR